MAGAGRSAGMLRAPAAGGAGACWRAGSTRRRPGAPALDVAQAGLGSLQRSTGLVRSPGQVGRGELPWVISGVVPDEEGGLVPPAGK